MEILKARVISYVKLWHYMRQRYVVYSQYTTCCGIRRIFFIAVYVIRLKYASWKSTPWFLMFFIETSWFQIILSSTRKHLFKLLFGIWFFINLKNLSGKKLDKYNLILEINPLNPKKYHPGSSLIYRECGIEGNPQF